MDLFKGLQILGIVYYTGIGTVWRTLCSSWADVTIVKIWHGMLKERTAELWKEFCLKKLGAYSNTISSWQRKNGCRNIFRPSAFFSSGPTTHIVIDLHSRNKELAPFAHNPWVWIYNSSMMAGPNVSPMELWLDVLVHTYGKLAEYNRDMGLEIFVPSPKRQYHFSHQNPGWTTPFIWQARKKTRSSLLDYRCWVCMSMPILQWSRILEYTHFEQHSSNVRYTYASTPLAAQVRHHLNYKSSRVPNWSP